MPRPIFFAARTTQARGSVKAATSSGMAGDSGMTSRDGRLIYSAKAPSVWMPSWCISGQFSTSLRRQ
jgi:hypothetical protein